MQTTKIIYETGATSHAVNDLILFTDNTRELAALRDEIYTKYKKSFLNHFDFLPLLIAAKMRYETELPDSCQHIVNMGRLQRIEYCTLYAHDFNNWKQENRIK